MSVYCSELYRSNRKPGNFENDLIYDIIAYYVQLGNYWPPAKEKGIPCKVGFIPIEKFLPDFFINVYIFEGGYEFVTLYDRWNTIRKKLSLYRSPYTSPRYLQHIYHEILLPYERQRKAIEDQQSGDSTTIKQEEMNPEKLVGYTIKLATCGHDGMTVWKWGTIVSYNQKTEEHSIILDEGLFIRVSLAQVTWQIGTWNSCAMHAAFLLQKNSAWKPSNIVHDNIRKLKEEMFRISMDQTSVVSILKPSLVNKLLESSQRSISVSNDMLNGKIIYLELDKHPTETQRTDIVRCACGWQVDTGDMVECSICKTWSHKYCIGVNAVEWDKIIESDYKCFMCNPNGVKKGSLAYELVKAIQSVQSQDQWTEHIQSIRKSELQASQLTNQDVYETIDDTEVAKYHPVFAENLMDTNGHGGLSRRLTPKLASKVKAGRKPGKDRFGGIRKERPSAPPFVRVCEEEERFVRQLQAFWAARSQPMESIPMFRGKPFDFYALCEGVRQRGGFKKVVENKQWPEIWKTMRNYYKESTDHSYQLKKYFERYLKRFMEECEDYLEDVKMEPIEGNAVTHENASSTENGKESQ
eukprot:jgi/Galph1/3301/GphlegSOOS_G1998.1